MAGHNKWKQIKDRKGVVDAKRGRNFSKILRAIAVAARPDPNPEFNPRLRSMIAQAREYKIPNENIERVINKSQENSNFEELRVEAYGPEGSALIIEIITDNRNRIVQELRKILGEHETKIAEQGSVLWTFNAPTAESFEWTPKFQQPISEEGRQKLDALIEVIEGLEDVQKVITNT